MIEVLGFARDGLDALEKIAELAPDVVTLDLIMPDLDGLGVLKSLPKDCQTKFIVVSVSGSDSDLAIEALHLGAVDLVTKPTALPTDRLFDIADELLTKIKAAAGARPRIKFPEAPKAFPDGIKSNIADNIKLIVLGTSTGGPQAISELFKYFPADFPIPLVIALHIPEGYTAPLAERISKTSQFKMVEAYDGMELIPNQAVIAPGGMHVQIKNLNGKIYTHVSREPEDTLYHPSIDLLFQSAAEQLGDSVLGVILTGMGSDGTKGALAIRKAGGHILAESASSCVVYGMPRSVIEGGAANDETTLENMANLIMKTVSKS